MLSVIVPWCDRNEMRAALPGMVDLVEDLAGELTIVNYGGNPTQFAEQTRGIQGLNIVERLEPKWFNKARANNIGAAASQGELLFFCDCDILLDQAAVSELMSLTICKPNQFGTLLGVRETEINSRQAGNLTCFGYTLHLRIANGRTLTIKDHEEDADNGTRQAPGLLMVQRSDFLRVNGYNGAFNGWGWEDQDMIARLTLGAGLNRVQHGIVGHISHGDIARTARYACNAANRWESRDRIFRQALSNYDANMFAGTFSEDAEVSQDQSSLFVSHGLPDTTIDGPDA